jgi:hypothetical protein
MTDILNSVKLPPLKKRGPPKKPYVFGRNNLLRQEAKARGDIIYNRGIPCGNGHTGPRYVKTNHCVECEKAAKLKHRKETKNEWFTNLKRNYGLSKEAYFLILKNQNEKCAICKSDLNKVKACVDHCHDTNKVRGILCHNCNVGIGNLKHNSEFLRIAALYCE